jgi:hypothetical protein
VYAGGFFNAIGGVARNRIAALDTTSDRVTAWNPGAGVSVDALAASGSIVYAGGSFTSIGASCTSMGCRSRGGIAALDATTGAASAWNPYAETPLETEPAIVDTLAVSSSTVYAGGQFARIGGRARNYIAAVDAVTGRATPWDPKMNMFGTFALAVSGSTVYAGGDFGIAAFGTTP